MPEPNFQPQESTDESKLNKLERAWLNELRTRQLPNLRIHAFTLKIADNCRYTPDFSALCDGRFVFYETKGFMRDDALVKLKVAARQFPEFDFILVQRVKREWVETKVNP